MVPGINAPPFLRALARDPAEFAVLDVSYPFRALVAGLGAPLAYRGEGIEVYELP